MCACYYYNDIVNTACFNFTIYQISVTVQLNQINYTDVTLSSNTSIQLPDLHSTVPYSTVVQETLIMEQYSLVQQYQSLYSKNGSSNEEYAKFRHNVHASTQVYY